MIRDDMLSSAYCSEISCIIYFQTIKKALFDYLFNLVLIVFPFKYKFSLKYYPQVFNCFHLSVSISIYEFQKWRAVRASVGGVGGVLAWWHASMGGLGVVLAWVVCLRG